MPITHVRTRATATIPTQQYGNVTLEIEVISEAGELELGTGHKAVTQLEDTHDTLVDYVRNTMDRTNPNVATWLKANGSQ